MDAVLGELCTDSFLACARKKIWWIIPNWGRSASDLVPETQYVLGRVEGSDLYVVISGMLDSSRFRTTLRPASGRLRDPAGRAARPSDACVRVESGRSATAASRWSQVLYLAVGKDPFALVNRAISRAAFLSGGARPREDKVAPPLLDLFGWCTWDAFYSEVDSDGIERGLVAMSAAGIRPGFVIIDDGWQQVAPAEEFRRPDNVMLSTFSDLPLSSSASQKNEAEKRTAKVSGALLVCFQKNEAQNSPPRPGDDPARPAPSVIANHGSGCFFVPLFCISSAPSPMIDHFMMLSQACPASRITAVFRPLPSPLPLQLVKEATNMAPVTASEILNTTVEAILGEEGVPKQSFIDTVLASILGTGTRALMWTYQTFVDKAAPFSLPFYAWRYLATGIG